MPNTGRPSKDCHLCRARRVKCDLAQPSCLRCATYGATCPGYRRQIDLMFQNESPETVAGGRKASRSGSLKRSSVYVKAFQSASTSLSAEKANTLKSGQSSSSTANSSGQPRTPLLKGVSTSLDAPAVSLLLDRFAVVLPEGRSLGFLDGFPDLYKSMSRSSCFYLATEAFAHAYLDSQTRNGMPKKSKWLYAAALKSTNLALSSSTEAVKDSTLAAVWVLGVYEILASWPPYQAQPGTSAWYQHTQGMASLLQLRGVEQFRSRRGKNIFWMTFGQIKAKSYPNKVTRSIEANVECPRECWDWLSAMEPHLDDLDRAPHSIWTFVLETSLLFPRVLRAINTPTPDHPSDSLPDLLDAFRAADATPVPAHLEAVYPTQGFLWNIYRCVRAKLNHTLIVLVDFARPTAPAAALGMLDGQRDASLATVQRLAEEILESVTERGGGVDSDDGVGGEPRLKKHCWGDALKKLWPLGHVARLCTCTARQQAQAGALMAQMSHELGIARDEGAAMSGRSPSSGYSSTSE